MKLLEALKGISGLVEVRPKLPIFDLKHGRLGNAEALRSGRLSEATCPDLAHDFRGEFAIANRAPSQPRAVNKLIGLVLTLRSPTQIGRHVIVTIAVCVANLMRWAWRGTYKRLCYCTVDVEVLRYAIDHWIDGQIGTALANRSGAKDAPHSSAGFWARSRRGSPYPAKVAHLVIRRLSYCSPNLTAIRTYSHVVSPHVRGQGRALLTQRFRPASYGRFTIRSQTRRTA